MIIFWRLLLAHFLTDFTLQTNFIAKWKRESIFGALAHSGIFLLLSMVLCVFSDNFSGLTTHYLFDVWWKLPGWLCVMLIFIIHFGEDYYRIWSIKEGGSSDNLLFFIWDQFIHIILIFLFSPIDTSFSISEHWVVIAILLILVTHFSSIFIYYIEQLIYGPEHIATGLKGKYHLMLERLTIFGCFLLPGRFWMMVIVVLLARVFLYKPTHDFSKINIISSVSLSILIGLLSRLILY
ncbi:MAG: DUF3307 domain-containing protein [Elusimicrobia bacterium]|nr:DUF3307 domain-containing protein [Elusimicrobiota bacterium]MBU2614713.1 DUF3307 domain-containing protein [Elusimicrobiota bacterium]